MATDDKLTTVAEKSDGLLSALFQASEDGLKLFVTLARKSPDQPSPTNGATPTTPAVEPPPKPQKPEAVTASQIRALIGTLADQKLIHGEIIEQLAVELSSQAQAAAGTPLERRRIAKGRPPVNGRDGKLLLLVKKFENKNSKQPREMVDPRFIHFFDNIEPRTVIGRVYPPTPGTDGIGFDGKPIPFLPGKSFEPKLDSSITISASGTYHELIAQQAGYLTIENDTLMVKNELVIGGDLNFSFGDIDFVGAVKINGSVQKDFTIKARGDIEISGDVNQARLMSKQGSITVKGSVVGDRVQSFQITEATSHQAMNDKMKSHGADLFAAKNISVSRIENAVIEAGLDVQVKRELKSCSLRTRTNLFIPDGQIVGGEVFAVCGVEAGTLGTERGTTTAIHAVSNIESSGEYVELDRQLKHHEAAEEVIKLYLGPYLKTPNRVVRLNAEYRRKIEDLMRKLKTIESAKERLNQDLEKLLAGAEQSSVFRVNVKKIAYPGVILLADDQRYQILEPLKGPVTIEYLGKEKTFSVGELKPVSCEMEKRPVFRKSAAKK